MNHLNSEVKGSELYVKQLNNLEIKDNIKVNITLLQLEISPALVIL